MTRLLTALALVSTLLFAAPAFAVIQGCLPNPLPPPTAPVFSRDVEKLAEQMHLDVWRVPCDGSFALLMKVTPLTPGRFLCERSPHSPRSRSGHSLGAERARDLAARLVTHGRRAFAARTAGSAASRNQVGRRGR